jgi:hypothetical protein
MAVQGASGSTGSTSGTARALHVALWLLAVLVFAQAVFAGLFLDGNAAWRDWHATNGMLLLAIFIQIGMGQTSQLAVHVPLGMAILGLTGALLGRTRNLTRASTDLSGSREPGRPVDRGGPSPEVLAVSHHGPSRASRVSGGRDIAVIRNSFDQPGVAMDGDRRCGV